MSDEQIAPCLLGSPYAIEAREMIGASYGLPANSGGALLRVLACYNLSFSFRAIENSIEDPIPPFKSSLLCNAAMFNARAVPALGFQLPEESQTDEQKTAGHYSGLFADLSPEHYFDEPAQLLKQRLERNGYDLSAFPKMVALDAGCGNGRYSVALRKLGMARVHGIDLSPDNVRDATERCRVGGVDGVSFRQGNVLNLPHQDDSFDFVFSNGVLHHTVDPSRGVKELVRVLKPGGQGFFKVMSDPGGMHWDFIELCRILLKNVPYDFAHSVFRVLNVPANLRYLYLDHMIVPINRRFTVDDCMDMLEAAGAKEIRQLTRGADVDRDERMSEPYASERFGIAVCRFYFSC